MALKEKIPRFGTILGDHGRIFRGCQRYFDNKLRIKSQEVLATPLKYNIDEPAEGTNIWRSFRLNGWVLPPNNISHLEVLIDERLSTIAEIGRNPRHDLSAAFPSIANAEMGGFSALVSIDDKEGSRKLTIKAVLKDGPRIDLCKITIINSKASAREFHRSVINKLASSDKLSIVFDEQRTQWYTADQIRELQEHLMRRLIHYAYDWIPYYQSLFKEHDIEPKDIEAIEDLKSIPVLTRKMAIENYDRLINPAFLYKTHLSGGTTGRRLKWAYSTEWNELFGRTLWRGFGWAGLTGDKRVVSFYSRVIGEVTRESLIIRDAYDPKKVKDDLEMARRFKPQFAYCYSSSAYLIARHLLNRRERMPLEGIITTSDQLFPQYRPVIEEAFQCPVFNNYGCNDGGAWGAECQEHSGLHHDFERSVIEFDGDGRMLTTDLWNYAMPLIRYENGDTGSWLNIVCGCGREMPLFKVTGRIDDYIITPSGRIISPTVISGFLREECFEDIRVIQRSESEVEIIYSRVKGHAIDNCEEKLGDLKALLKDMEVSISEVDYIQRPTSNKHKLVENWSKASLDGIL